MFIFDLDGTLIDSRQDIVFAVNLARESYDLPLLPFEFVIKAIGNGAATLICRCFENTDVAPEEALKRYKDAYAAHLLDNTRLYDGVAESLAFLRERNIPMAVVTNKPEKATRTILDGLGILDYFSIVIGGGSGFVLKPAPDALLHCLEVSGEEAGTSWMIGDHYTDLESGRRAGMKRGFARWGFGETRGEDFDADLLSPDRITGLAVER